MNNEVIESVHLGTWPTVEAEYMNEKVLQEMETVRKLVEMGLSLRSEAGVKVRQVLYTLELNLNIQLSEEYINIIAEELNVRQVVLVSKVSPDFKQKQEGEVSVALDVQITEDLKKEGLIREVVRSLNQIRKDMGLTVQDRVTVVYSTEDEVLKSVFAEYNEELKKNVLATELRESSTSSDQEGKKQVEIDGRVCLVSMEKL
jgi:isoleucyl-tRNA synthetase